MDPTVQADRQAEFAGAFAASRHKTGPDEALQSSCATPSMLGGWGGCLGR